MSLTFLTGGARSGKSSLAVKIATATARPVTVVATGVASDDEMAARIARHRGERPDSWKVIEEPLDLGGAIDEVAEDDFAIVDCLTLWVSNLMADGRSDDEIIAIAGQASKALASRRSDSLVVTNEVGDGLVPMEPLGRRFRDVLGIVNAIFAGASERAYLVVAGRTLELGE